MSRFYKLLLRPDLTMLTLIRFVKNKRLNENKNDNLFEQFTTQYLIIMAENKTKCFKKP